MQPIMSGLLIFTLFYLLVDILVKKSNFGILPSTIQRTLFGNEEQFIEPLSQVSFLEMIHSEIFFIMMILLTVSAIFVRVSQNHTLRLWIINVTLFSALLSIITLSFTFYLNPLFLNLYVVTFYLWHIFAFFMAFYSIWKLSFAKSL